MRLQDRLIRNLEPPASGARITYDEDVHGFGIRITAKDARSFVLNYVVADRERRLTIGGFPTWSATAAREEARRLRRLVDAQIDPLEQRATEAEAAAAERSRPTVRDLYERYATEHLPRKAARSASDDRAMWEKLVLPRLGNIKVRDLSHDDIDGLHAEITKTRPIRANRVLEVVRKALNLAIRWGWRTDNPARGTQKNPEERRTRYLTPAELLRLSEAMNVHPERTSVNAIRLILLTGARRGEVLGARWDMFDLDTGIWIKPSAHTKQRREHRIPLSTAAINLLKGLRTGATEPFVFPGRDGRPLVDVKRTWLTICHKAGLTETLSASDQPRRTEKSSTRSKKLVFKTIVRVHDLRHTYAAVLASEGLSLPIIGALLGHTQPQTTARYAHLLDDPLRAATEKAAQILGENAGSPVVPGVM